MAKRIIYHQEAHEKILSGVEKLSKTVAITMGPRGQNVLVGRSVGAPILTKDGVSVAREVVLEDFLEEQGCQLIKEVSGRTADVAGDGTTTATVLAHEILSRGQELIKSGYSPITFREGIKLGVEKILENIEEQSQPVETEKDLVDIATISANNDLEIGECIAEAFDKVGWDGTVAAEAKPGVLTNVRTVDGIELGSGYINSAFLSGEKNTTECVLENCYVLIIDRELSHVEDCTKLFTEIAKENKSILVIARDIKKRALQFLAENKHQGLLNAVAVKHPTFGPAIGDWLFDLALSTGTTVASEDLGNSLAGFTTEKLGFAEKIIVNKNTTKIIGGRRDVSKIDDRIEKYKGDVLTQVGDLDRLDIRNRISFLKNKVAVITVGYTTELELRQKGDRVEDAIFATRAAIEDGVVPGGGVALIRASRTFDGVDKKYSEACEVLRKACERPFRQIVENAEQDPDKLLAEVLKLKHASEGYDAAENKFGDMYEMGIVDPAKVTKTALTVASSIASLLIRTNAIIADIPDNPSGWQPPAGYRMPDQDTTKNHKY